MFYNFGKLVSSQTAVRYKKYCSLVEQRRGMSKVCPLIIQ